MSPKTRKTQNNNWMEKVDRWELVGKEWMDRQVGRNLVAGRWTDEWMYR